MIEPTVRKVAPAPRCYQCGATSALILNDGPVICRPCVRICVRLVKAGAKP